jgi:hypothetical protein
MQLGSILKKKLDPNMWTKEIEAIVESEGWNP